MPIETLEDAKKILTTDEPDHDERYELALTRFAQADDPHLAKLAVTTMLEERKALGVIGHEKLSERKLKALLRAVEVRENIPMLQQKVLDFERLQRRVYRDIRDDEVRAATFKRLRKAEAALDEALGLRRSFLAARIWDPVASVAAAGLDTLFFVTGGAAERIAAPLTRLSGAGPLSRMGRGVGQVIHGFLSYESLRRTGLETSWGFRTYIPGTFGLAGNAGPWVMLYSGRLVDAQARMRPMLVNPGATFATPVWIATLNRPGIGAGGALGPASAYLDRARYKLLIGVDGVGYARIGDWVGRGPYFTISASIPIAPATSVTWNFSVFSPGFAPLVRWSTPAAIWVRRRTKRLMRVLGAPVRLLRRALT